MNIAYTSLLISLVALSSVTPLMAFAAHISISCGGIGEQFELCKSGSDAWAKKTGNSVTVMPTPAETGERLSLYQQYLAAKSPDIDVYYVDTIWPGIIGDFLLDLNPYVNQTIKSQFFDRLIENDTVQGRLVALPWFTEAGLLFYRKDLLEKYHEPIPTTWQQLGSIAERVQAGERKAGNDRFWGFVFQARSYEGLTCNALEWVNSFGGGTILNTDGKITINNPRAAEALKMIASWIGKISPRGVLNYKEEESRGVFQSGNALFLRNWPYVWSLAQGTDSPVRGKIGMTVLPHTADGPSSSTLGDAGLAVSKFSRNPAISANLVLYLTSPEEQKRRALFLGLTPTMPALYKDPEVMKAYPQWMALYPVFAHAVARPARMAGTRYARVSMEFAEAVHDAISGNGTPEENLLKLEKSLKWISRGEKWH